LQGRPAGAPGVPHLSGQPPRPLSLTVLCYALPHLSTLSFRILPVLFRAVPSSAALAAVEAAAPAAGILEVSLRCALGFPLSAELPTAGTSPVQFCQLCSPAPWQRACVHARA